MSAIAQRQALEGLRDAMAKCRATNHAYATRVTGLRARVDAAADGPAATRPAAFAILIHDAMKICGDHQRLNADNMADVIGCARALLNSSDGR